MHYTPLKIAGALMLVFNCFSYLPAENVSISGVIKNAVTQQPVVGATITLAKHPSITTTTNSSGAYTLAGIVPISFKPANSAPNAPYYSSNGLTFRVSAAKQQTTVELYSLSGKRVATVLDQVLAMGDYRLDPFSGFVNRLGDQAYIIAMHSGNSIFTFKAMAIKTQHLPFNRLQKTPINIASSEKTRTTAIDTLVVSINNYKTYRTALTSYTCFGNVNLTRSDIVQGKIAVTSVSPKGLASLGWNLRSDTSAFQDPNVAYGFINSGAPDSMIITLKRIQLKSTSGYKTVWNGAKELTLKGTGALSLSDLFMDSIPRDTITEISLILSDKAKICGTLNGKFNKDTSNSQYLVETKTFYTKNSLAYNAADYSGGADSSVGRYAAFETAPAELADISLSAGRDADTNMSPITTNVRYIYDSTKATPSVTILFDMSRLLRFYNGCNLHHTGGVNPPDPERKAYFFCHSVFKNSVAAFFDSVGEIQGYETMYSHVSGGYNSGVPGWFTAIFNPGGAMLSGILIGNDDNAFTIAKGMVDTVQQDTAYNFHYNISGVYTTGFKRKSIIGDSTFIRWHQVANPPAGTPDRVGKARFTLRFISY